MVRAAERLGVARHVTTAATADLAVGGVSDPAALAGRLWPSTGWPSATPWPGGGGAATLGDSADDRRMPDAAYLPGALAMALAWLRRRPLLPPDAAPPWAGARPTRWQPRPGRAVGRAGRLARPSPGGALDDIVEGVPPGAGGAPDPGP